MSLSRHAEIADELRRRIASGEYTNELPVIPDLMDQFDVGRSTVRQALQALIAEGLIEGGRGQPMRVQRLARVQWAMSTLLRDLPVEEDAWAEAVRQHGRTPSTEVSIHLVRADKELATALDVQPGDPVVLRSHLRHVDGLPHHRADSYFPRWLVDAHPDFAEPDAQFTTRRLLTAAGLPQKLCEDSITARVPARDEAQQLKISSSVPMLIHIRIGYGQDDRPLRFTRTCVAADRADLRYQVEA